MLRKILSFLFIISFVTSCYTGLGFGDLQGHRGARGTMPENTIPGFLEAIDLGVTTLELDVVISKDNKVVVSHEPFFSHVISSDPDGNQITKDKEKDYNLYKMDYETIKKFDVGMTVHPHFPDQKKIKVYKPLLSEVINQVEEYCEKNNLHKMNYNIEIKRVPQNDNKFHPSADVFVSLVLGELEKYSFDRRITIQSFDVETLQIIRSKTNKYKLSYLIENKNSIEENLNKLGFTPEIYSPDFAILNKNDIKKCHKLSMKVIPWTVNERADVDSLLNWGVDGIITDYPEMARETIIYLGYNLRF